METISGWLITLILKNIPFRLMLRQPGTPWLCRCYHLSNTHHWILSGVIKIYIFLNRKNLSRPFASITSLLRSLLFLIYLFFFLHFLILLEQLTAGFYDFKKHFNEILESKRLKVVRTCLSTKNIFWLFVASYSLIPNLNLRTMQWHCQFFSFSVVWIFKHCENGCSWIFSWCQHYSQRSLHLFSIQIKKQQQKILFTLSEKKHSWRGT